MIQRRSRPGLSNEAPLAVGISHVLRRQDFERHHAAELGILGLIDDTHTSAVELLQDAIVGNGLTDGTNKAATSLA